MKRSPMKIDPERVREWQARSRASRKRRQKIPETVVREVRQRSRGRCVVCGEDGSRGRMTRHHVLPVREWPEFEREPANMVLVCWTPCHANHEAAHRRIRWTELPASVRAFVRQQDKAALAYAARTYPR